MHLQASARAPRSGTLIGAESNRPAGDIESISRDFGGA